MSGGMAGSLARYGSVTLDEVVGGASLLTRVDRKYMMWRDEAERLLAGLPTGFRVLETDGQRLSTYESVYFDTPDLLSFRLAARSRPRRFKLRTRAYLDADAAYLEVKTRSTRRVTVKERMCYGIDERHELTPLGRQYAVGTLAGAGVETARVGVLEPVVTTRYRRGTLLQPDGLSRATVDIDLSWQDADAGTLTLGDVAIIETKSGGHASALDRVLWAHGYRPESFSKYATGLAALHPGLPSNKWHRPLTTYFTR
ncbi:VTC domain-containing protein [Brooklawnia cerclae]|uniref:VTC domain-containing protein n=1 Tax=Brooklawnia cerclae TaxID=349934 RepID=A0ABX0SC75_9ACTN|nr:polyphosphate polymerase domain-containing protein [Brooklawnia cerclae]NIH55982.1 hypothetical protein [Brooklawnia cerclae]